MVQIVTYAALKGVTLLVYNMFISPIWRPARNGLANIVKGYVSLRLGRHAPCRYDNVKRSVTSTFPVPLTRTFQGPKWEKYTLGNQFCLK